MMYRFAQNIKTRISTSRVASTMKGGSLPGSKTSVSTDPATNQYYNGISTCFRNLIL